MHFHDIENVFNAELNATQVLYMQYTLQTWSVDQHVCVSDQLTPVLVHYDTTW